MDVFQHYSVLCQHYPNFRLWFKIENLDVFIQDLQCWKIQFRRCQLESMILEALFMRMWFIWSLTILMLVLFFCAVLQEYGANFPGTSFLVRVFVILCFSNKSIMTILRSTHMKHKWREGHLYYGSSNNSYQLCGAN